MRAAAAQGRSSLRRASFLLQASQHQRDEVYELCVAMGVEQGDCCGHTRKRSNALEQHLEPSLQPDERREGASSAVAREEDGDTNRNSCVEDGKKSDLLRDIGSSRESDEEMVTEWYYRLCFCSQQKDSRRRKSIEKR